MIIGYTFIILGIVMIIIKYLFRKNNHLVIKSNPNNNKLAIVIPAKYESKVIEGLIISIEKQSLHINNNDVYVVIEALDDPAIDIIKRHQVNYILKSNIKDNRKGYALNDAFKVITKEKDYDAYFIIDADNVLDKDYLLNMSKTLGMGYDIGIGYRNTKNGNSSIVSSASSLTFSMLNTLDNKNRLKNNCTLTISGTGFYIKGSIVKKWGGYPFHSLTEDYELTLYAALNELTVGYNEAAIFYDEQPIKYNDSIIQRTRWIKGYFEARKKYIGLIRKRLFKKSNNVNSLVTELIGVKPFICLLIGILILIILNIKNYLYILIVLLFIYLILFLFTLLLLYKEHGKLNINRQLKIRLLYFYPVFMLSYIRCAIIALFSPNLGWKKIEHTVNNKSLI